MIESNYLKDSIQNIQKLMIIPPLRRFEKENLKQLLKLSKVREYKPDEAIIKEGEKDPWIYFLLEGSVRVVKEDEPLRIIDRVGELFGELRILDGLTRSASVFAETRAVCLGVDTSVSKTRLSSDERVDILLLLYRIFSEYMAARLRMLNEELVTSKKEYEELLEKADGE